jgi:hypothetical protein
MPSNYEQAIAMPKTIATSWFNADLLKSLRGQYRWTQEELAAHADVSRRVVAKAEGSEPVASRTIKAFVRAFRQAGADVQEADFTIDIDMLARRFLTNYATYEADCVKHSLDFLSPDIVAVLDGDPETNPIAGEHRGLEEFDKLWKTFFGMFVRVGGTLGDNPETRCVGNEVIAWGHEAVHLPGVSPVAAGFVLLRMTFKDGKMVRFVDHYEAAGMMLTLEKYCEEFPDADWAKRLRANAASNRV